MLYTGPGAAALTGRRGRNLTVIMQARFAEKLIVQSGRFNGNESGTAGTATVNLLPSLKGNPPLGDGFLLSSLKDTQL